MTQQNRRNFLKTTAAAAGATMPYWFTSAQRSTFGYASANERPVLGCIGTGSRWGSVGPAALKFADSTVFYVRRKNRVRLLTTFCEPSFVLRREDEHGCSETNPVGS
ncbi:MAG: hypothetical protein ACI92S_004643, partial [Planctomycetaceae bacterium]